MTRVSFRLAAIFKNIDPSILGSGAHLWSLDGRVWHGYETSLARPGTEYAYGPWRPFRSALCLYTP